MLNKGVNYILEITNVLYLNLLASNMSKYTIGSTKVQYSDTVFSSLVESVVSSDPN